MDLAVVSKIMFMLYQLTQGKRNSQLNLRLNFLTESLSIEGKKQ